MALSPIIVFLIWICIAAAVVYLVIYVLRDVVGVPIPAKLIQIAWVIFMLLCLLWLLQMFAPSLGVS